MPRKQICDLVEVQCAYCGKPLMRSMTQRNQQVKRFFCTQSHYFSWVRESRPVEEIRYRHEEGQLLAELQRVANILGHLPTFEEMKAHGQVYPGIYHKRFGSWYMALANITDPSPEAAWDITQVSPEDGGWLAGIADGESTFRLALSRKSYVCIWGFQLRADDIYAAEEIKRVLGLAKRPLRWWDRKGDRKRGIDAGDAVRFYVRDIPTHFAHTVPFFRRFPLRSKKQLEFPLFAEAVELLHNHQSQGLHKPYPIELRTRLAEIKTALKEAKHYKHPAEIDDYLATHDPLKKQFNRRRIFNSD